MSVHALRNRHALRHKAGGRGGEGGGRWGTKQAAYDDEQERMPLLDDVWEAAACRHGVGIKSEKQARSGRNRNDGVSAHTAYEEREPLLDDVLVLSEAGGHEGAGIGRFVTSPSARRRFATRRWADSASRSSCAHAEMKT